jgi:hypothetical protein
MKQCVVVPFLNIKTLSAKGIAAELEGCIVMNLSLSTVKQ